MLKIRKIHPAVLFALLAMILALCTAVPAQAASASAPSSASSSAPTLSAAERQRIVIGYNTTAKVRLSFDDCASNQAKLSSILNTLKSYRVQAIFFFTGDCARAHPNWMSQIVAAGQYLGNHSSNHADYAKLTSAQVKAQIAGGVRGTTNPRLCRPPYGNMAFTDWFYRIAATMGCKPAYWSVDTRDWSGSSTATILRRVFVGDQYTPPARKGGLILMHATSAHGWQAVGPMIAGLRARGFQV